MAGRNPLEILKSKDVPRVTTAFALVLFGVLLDLGVAGNVGVEFAWVPPIIGVVLFLGSKLWSEM